MWPSAVCSVVLCSVVWRSVGVVGGGGGGGVGGGGVGGGSWHLRKIHQFWGESRGGPLRRRPQIWGVPGVTRFDRKKSKEMESSVCHATGDLLTLKNGRGGPPPRRGAAETGRGVADPSIPSPILAPPERCTPIPHTPPFPFFNAVGKTPPSKKCEQLHFYFFVAFVCIFFHFRASPNFAISTLQFPHCNFHIAFSTFVFLHSFAFPALSARKIQPKNRSKK